jgi:hypothetical protein
MENKDEDINSMDDRLNKDLLSILDKYKNGHIESSQVISIIKNYCHEYYELGYGEAEQYYY